MSRAVIVIGAALAAANPPAAGVYRKNAQGFAAEVRSTGIDYESTLSTCPRRTIATADGAFAAIARQYDLSDLILGAATNPSPAQVAKAAQQVTAAGLTTVFSEPFVPVGHGRGGGIGRPRQGQGPRSAQRPAGGRMATPSRLCATAGRKPGRPERRPRLPQQRDRNVSDPLSAVSAWPATAAAGVATASLGVINVTGTDQARFPWASVTKVLTALAVWLAVEEGHRRVG